MTSPVRFDWRGAFSQVGIDATSAQRGEVCRAIMDWNGDWTYDTDGGYIVRVEDEDGEGIWDIDYDDCEDVDQFFSDEFLEYMDFKFLLKRRAKKPVVIGAATKLPLPGSRP